MWEESPYCRKCGKITRLYFELESGGTPKNAATIEHIYPVGTDKRKEERRNGCYSKALYCYGCNKTADLFFRITGKIYHFYSWTVSEQWLRNLLKFEGKRKREKKKFHIRQAA